MTPTVYISGVASGPNPAAGLGIARSLRAAYSNLRLVGVDYSPASSGLHSDLFDKVWVERAWGEIHLPTHLQVIRTALQPGSFWLPGLDLEVHWLAREGLGGSTALVPPHESLADIAKPSIRGARMLPVSQPDSLSTTVSDRELHAFCRRHGWRVWLKGPHYGACRVTDWQGFCRSRTGLQELWQTDRLLLQAHVTGSEESVAFAAHRGVLLGCVRMEKRAQTEQGKTWAGHVCEVPEDFLASLRNTVAALNWTGGGELEFVRDSHGTLNLIDWNPRFPAWIYGATLAGVNLPARLLEAAGVGTPLPEVTVSREFTRIVFEIPGRAGLPLPALRMQDGFGGLAGKHVPGAPGPAGRRPAQPRRSSCPPPVSEELQSALARCRVHRTPVRFLLDDVARCGFQSLARIAAEPVEGVTVRFAYSVKTNPHPKLLKEAQTAGLLAEVISTEEAESALLHGFAVDGLVVNGPLAGQVKAARGVLAAWFADSVEALEHRGLTGLPAARVAGVRLRLPGTSSRFGIDVADADRFEALVELLGRFPPGQRLGLHFHMASDTAGVAQWWRLWRAFLAWAQAIEECVGRPISCLDAGGGWYPDDFETEFLPKIPEMIGQAKRVLPHLEELIVEPGKALAQPSMVLVAEVVELRTRKDGPSEAVVDAGVSDLPFAAAFPHAVLAQGRNKRWHCLAGGDDRILGRLCMEDDVLARGIAIPESLRVGDPLVFTDAGGYDASMAYRFGRGDAVET